MAIGKKIIQNKKLILSTLATPAFGTFSTVVYYPQIDRFFHDSRKATGEHPILGVETITPQSNIACQNMSLPKGCDLENKSKPWTCSAYYSLKCCIPAEKCKNNISGRKYLLTLQSPQEQILTFTLLWNRSSKEGGNHDPRITSPRVRWAIRYSNMERNAKIHPLFSAMTSGVHRILNPIYTDHHSGADSNLQMS